MRRDSRKKIKNKTMSDKIIMYSSIGVIILALIVFALLMYSKNLNKEVKDSTLSIEKIASITANEQSSESASSTIGKSIEEAESLEKNNETSNSSTNSSVEQKTVVNTNKLNTNKLNTTSTNSTANIVNTEKLDTDNDAKETAAKKELNFEKPVEGEITKEYAKDNLIYSETLKEWITHMGIDIKADKTTVVKAAEEGTVKTIKNDPRYGITVVIEHQDGFQTVYANLLTSEFVVEGEKIEKGQSVGTVGNTAVFEIADEPHLHFEILKDSIQVDPTLYIK